MDTGRDAIVVGGGLAGLVCARQLCDAGFSCQLLEASDPVGGRVRTDEVEGFLKLRIASFRRHTARGELKDVYNRTEQPTIDLLRERGFSNVVIERFFRPFLGGVFLDSELQTSSRMCEFSCLYFAAPQSPVEEPILVLNGDGSGPINNLCVPSQVSPSYAPDGQSLISVTVLGRLADPQTRLDQIRSQLKDWFGPSVESWRHLKTYDIENALPAQSPPALDPVAKSPQVRQGVFVCGDHCDTGSINGAMAAGRRAADAAMAALRAS